MIFITHPSYHITMSNMKNKRVAQIGTGVSGVQCIQETGPKVKHLTKTWPSLSMNRRKLDPKEEGKKEDG